MRRSGAYNCAMGGHEHEWEVYSTALVGAVIMVRCGCGALGGVPGGRYEESDWDDAFYAPSAPYPLREGLAAEVVVGRPADGA